jgi:hypothetical protein
MPLTRHLYMEDEVVAAMQWCILRGKYVESAFWCQELLDSGMADALLEAMRSIWLFGFGIGALPWYKAFQTFAEEDVLDPSEAVRLVVALCIIGKAGGRDTSFLSMIGSPRPPDRVGMCITPKGLKGVDAFFASAVKEGRAITAWRAYSQGSMAADTLARVSAWKHGSIGQELCTLLQEKYPAVAVAALCLPRESLEERWNKPLPVTPPEVEDALVDWEASLGRRQRRSFSIPHECLYLITERGCTSVYSSTESRLRGSLERPGKLWGSVFWDEIAEEMGGWEAIRDDPTAREQFYDTYFPDDIPDEWSKTDRERSHGLGALQKDETPSPSRFLSKWFGNIPSAVIWDQCKQAIDTRNGKTWVDWVAPHTAPFELDMRRIIRCEIIILQ